MSETVAHEILLVPQQHSTIQAALDAASGPTTIVVEPARYSESLRVLDKHYVVIQSARLSRRGVTLSGDGGLAVLRVEGSTLHLSGIEVRSKARGRGLRAVNSSISFQECVVAGNHVGEEADEPYGAGLLCRGSKVRIQKSTVTGNVIDRGSLPATAGGGGLFFQDCQVEIAGSAIQANEVYAAGSARGGGVWCERSTLRMWRSRVTDNALHGASCEGAGLYLSSPLDCQLGGSVITGNGSPRARGGGIFVQGDPARVHIHRNTVVRQNHPTDIDFG
jgi:hypothetical protein